MQCVPLNGSILKSIGSSWLVLAVLLVLLGGCASTPTVSRHDSSEEIDVSGFWNDTDSRLVSEEMVADSLGRLWIDEWRGATGGRPTVIVGAVHNRSSEHINTRTFTKDLERSFVNSGRVRLVASSDERGGMREERLDQLRHSTLDTAKSMGKEVGADFMLIGGINTIIDAAGGKSVRFYQVELELINLESNEKVWIGQKKIKKVVKRPGYRF
ncbi:MAG: penicillin-binding protein activator LpoB [bacterium]|nr:penicillin-binding protein activator LpoB [Deltaproteobacteria bacterium]MCP4903507.1 penicillin-binding protein activator LpoB [bacterium]